MYNSERIIIEPRNLMIEDVYDRYKQGQIIFFAKSNVSRSRKNKITKEILEALYRGIPFPPVYVSELQTGELLVLDKSDRLRYLMEFLDHGFSFETLEEYSELNNKFERYYNRREIFYSKILLYVIDYMNPRYMHMQVGAFIEEWSMTQEQSVRNVLYRELNDSPIRELLSEMKYVRNVDFTLESQFLYFLMVHLVAINAFGYEEYVFSKEADRFVLLDKTIYKLVHMPYGYLEDIRDRFEECYYFVKYKRDECNIVERVAREYRTNYICFLGIWKMVTEKNELELFSNSKIRRMIQNCDMSFENINQIIDCFRRRRYD